MTDLRQAAQQALEALEEYVNVVVSVNDPNEWTPKVADAGSPARKAITALREALAQPEQEPTQWRDMVVVSLVREGINKHRARELADHFAAQRPWQGLTDEEVQFYIEKHSKLVNAGYDKATDTNLVAKTFDSTSFYKEVSAALKERNHG
jgi:hypothetical protein